jgi:phenylalanyl-tRNA synthetase beta chain
MKTPFKWLKDYVNIEIPPEEFRDKMVMSGNAVEGMENQGEGIRNVVAGKIIKLAKHPDADKLQICQVDVGAETVQIVTGADNVFEGALVPVALHDSLLPTGQHIKKGKLRGVESFGMLCSGEELKLTEGDYEGAGIHGILIIKEDFQPGTDIREVFSLNDTIFEFEVGANRPDCLSILGLAREAAAVCDTKLTPPDTSYAEDGGTIADFVAVTVEDTKLCPRYMARAIRNVKIAPSPKWMKERLRAAGVRPINNIVDITNFVMLEMGQPMHAFDLKDIQGQKIIVRRAKPKEKMKTLDGKERELTENMLMICDRERVIGIAGIMGGENSEIKEDTQTVIFEAAKFTYGNIRQSSRALGLSTESSMRFSKGVDTGSVAAAMDRALHLVQQLGAGEIVGGGIDILSEDISPRRIETEAAKINALLGTDIPAQEMADILNRLHIETKLAGDTLVCDVPGYRGDIEGRAHLAEEVARIYGYDRIPVKKMQGEIIRGRMSAEQALRDRLKVMLSKGGFFECVTYSFGSQSALDKLNIPQGDPLRNTIRLLNPLGDDKSVMRTTPAADMLTVVSTNLSKKVKDIRLFEAGKVYIPKVLPLNELPDEKPYLCMALCGKDEDFYTMKGAVENILWQLNAGEASFEEGGPCYLHPGRKAKVFAGGTELGCIGEVHPEVAANFDIGERVVLAELYIRELLSVADDERKYQALPRFPGMERDLAFIVDKDVTAGSLQALIRKEGGRHLESVALFDVFADDKLGRGKKSMAYSMVFRAGDRTLTDEETAKAVAKIVDAAGKEFGAELRR